MLTLFADTTQFKHNTSELVGDDAEISELRVDKGKEKAVANNGKMYCSQTRI